MREILFRGKRDGDGEWVMGDRAGYSDYVMIWDLIDKGVGYLVDPATVGQFTGLCDDKGRKVFEGDIIDVRGRFKSEVRYISLNAGYLIKDNYGDWKWLYDVLASMPCEVIGNIYDKEEQDALQGKFAQNGRCTFDE